jgi:hypothetical protein
MPHKDMKGHIGGVMLLGNGSNILHIKEAKNCIKELHQGRAGRGIQCNATSALGPTFLEAQGMMQLISFCIRTTTKAPSSLRRTVRHQAASRQDSMMDHMREKDVSIEYCPTGDMVLDYFTKPLQGLLF